MKELKAREFAVEAHGKQMYGDKPYVFHLESVVNIAKNNNLNADVVIGCWLHDTIEDCNVSYQDVKKEFGQSVAEIVYAVTDELGRNRKERKLKTYPKIKAIEDAVCVKLCDRIANLNQSIVDREEGLLSMYIKEHKVFKKELFDTVQNDITKSLWAKLELLILKTEHTI